MYLGGHMFLDTVTLNTPAAAASCAEARLRDGVRLRAHGGMDRRAWTEALMSCTIWRIPGERRRALKLIHG